jgi:hypothetical protein
MANALRKSNEYMTGAPAVASKTTATEMPTFDDADAATMQGIQGYGATTGGQAAVAPDPFKAANALIESGIPALQTAGINQQMEFQKTNAAEARAQANRAKNLALWEQSGGDAVKFAALGGDLDMAKTMAELPGIGKVKGIVAGDSLVNPYTGDKISSIQRVPNRASDLLIPDENGNLVPNTPLIKVQSEIKASGRPPAAPRNVQTINTADGPMILNPDGTVRPITGPTGEPVRGPEKATPLTEGQARAVAFGTRMQNADQILNDLGKSGTNAIIPGANNALMNPLLSKNQQKAVQAQRDFVNAVLRRESGAVISDQEFANAAKQYFPQVGDSPEVIAQKAQNRKIAIAGIQADIPQSSRNLPNQIIQNTRPSSGGGQGGNIVDFGSLK